MALSAKASEIGIWANALPVIEVEEHCRTLGSGDQQIFKFAQRMRTNHISLIRGEHVTIRTFVDEDIEVIHPEIGHHFIKLSLAVDSSQQLRLDKLALNHLLRIHHRQQRFFLLRRETLDQPFALLMGQRMRNRTHGVRTHLHQICDALGGRGVH